jgi:L-cystine transport system ATP-binding protein
MIRLSGIEKSFGDKRVLRGISMTVETGHIFAVLGPSGSGKSTLLRCVNFLERPSRGTIETGGRTVDAGTASSRDILFLRNRTAMVFQQFNLFQNLTVTGNVMLGLTDVKKMSKREARETSLRLLDRVGLSDKADYYPPQLSGGQQQRVGIARALAMKPDVLLLDEPTSSLDPELIEDVLRCIVNVAADVDSMIAEDYNAAHGPKEQIIIRYISGTVPTAENLLGVANGRVDAVIDDPVMSNAVIKEQGLDLDVIPSPVQSDPIAVALAKNDAGAELKALLDPVIDELLTDGTLKALSVKWTESDYVPRR